MSSANLVDGAVSFSKLGNGAVTTDKIANGAVTKAKMSIGYEMATRTWSHTAGSGSRQFFAQDCPTGKRVLGGGYSIEDPWDSTARVTYNKPPALNGTSWWLGVYRPVGVAAPSGTLWAICAALVKDAFPTPKRRARA